MMSNVVNERMHDEDPYTVAKRIALRRLDRRECSSLDIQKNLIQKGISLEIAQKVVAELVEKALIDDVRFSRMLVNQQVMRGKGLRVIQQKLREKGISLPTQQVADLTVELSATSEAERARTLVERKYPNAWTNRSEASKAFQALVRRGFSFQVAKDVLNKKSVDS